MAEQEHTHTLTHRHLRTKLPLIPESLASFLSASTGSHQYQMLSKKVCLMHIQDVNSEALSHVYYVGV